MKHLKSLQTLFVALDLTDTQRKKKAERKHGRALWEKGLAGHREHEAGKKKSIKDTAPRKNAPKTATNRSIMMNASNRQLFPLFGFASRGTQRYLRDLP